MTETPEFSGSPEMFIRRYFSRSLAVAVVSNELLWAVSELVDRMDHDPLLPTID